MNAPRIVYVGPGPSPIYWRPESYRIEAPERLLNERPPGRARKLHAFDRAEAAAILDEGFDRHVLVGQAAALAFGLVGVPYLEEKLAHNLKHNKPQYFLVFPPDGIWWDEAFNRFRANRRLREFLLT